MISGRRSGLQDGVFMYFVDNAGVIVNPKVELTITAITGPSKT